MALKDWKRTENTKVSVVFKNMKDERDYVTIEKNIISDKFVLRTPDIGSSKYFKTKSQALKFAKSYMRKH